MAKSSLDDLAVEAKASWRERGCRRLWTRKSSYSKEETDRIDFTNLFLKLSLNMVAVVSGVELNPRGVRREALSQIDSICELIVIAQSTFSTLQ